MKEEIYNLVRPHYRELTGYVSAGMGADKTADLTFLNANENPYELPGLEGLNRYPEPQSQNLRTTYADAYNVKEEYIFMSRGADESISLLSKVFCEPHKDSVLISSPTFGIYGVDAQSMPAAVIDIPLIKKDGTFTLDTDSIIREVKSGSAKIIYICSPNNPSGTSFDRKDILEIIKAAKNKAIVVIDEAYIEFAGAESLTSELENHPHMMILRTLSKAYSLAGARMGTCLCADAEFIRFMMEKASQTYPLPKGSIDAAMKALSMQEQVQENIDKVLTERERVQSELENNALVAKVYESDANFLLVKMEQAKAFATFCMEQNLVVRDFSEKKGTKNTLRISIGTPDENNELLALLKQFQTQAA